MKEIENIYYVNSVEADVLKKKITNVSYGYMNNMYDTLTYKVGT